MKQIDPVRAEELRTFFATQNNLQSLRATYEFKFSVGPRPSSFWNAKIRSAPPVPQDCITKDRIRTVMKMLPHQRGVRVLDVGAGYGFIEEKLSCIPGIQEYGIDISTTAINRLKENYDGCFEVGSATALPYKAATFDAVLLLEVLEHLEPKNSLEALREAHRVLKRGGILIISVPVNEGIRDMEELKRNPSGHIRIYSEPLISKELEMCNFTIVRVNRLYAFNTFYYLKKFLVRFTPGYRKPNDLVILARKP
jgi:ubiquinone/menaquinone biosynthesis C-methylase UbiE